MTKQVLVYLFLFLANWLSAQDNNDIAIGEWQLHLPYKDVKSVTHSAEKIYFASKYSILSKDKTDGSLEFYDLVTGLAETDIRFIKYSEYAQALFVVYQNSNIDIIKGDEIINLPIIMNKQIIGDKFVYDVSFAGNRAYLSCGFGIVALNQNTFEVDFSTFTDKPVKGLVLVGDTYYASVTDGLYRIAKNDVNIQDFLQWHRLGSDEGLPVSFAAGNIGTLNEHLYFDANNQLIKYNIASHITDTVYSAINHRMVKLTQEGEGLLATFLCDDGNIWDRCDGHVIYVSGMGQVDTIGAPNTYRPVDAIQDGADIWLGDTWFPYRKVSINGGYQDVFTVNAPYSARAFDSKVIDDTLYVLAGTWSPTKSYPDQPVPDGLFLKDLNNGQWDYVNRAKYPFLAEAQADYNYMDIEVHPVNHKKYIASFSGGIIEKDGENFKIFNHTNSSLQPEFGYDSRVAVLDLAFDQENNLWATNYNTSKPLAVFKNDGSWQSFSIGVSHTLVNHLLIDDYNNKWVIVASSGLLVLSTGESLNDTSDDQYKLFNSNNSELPVNQVNAIAKDKDGSIWVGTDEGAIVFECGGDVLGEFCVGSRQVSTLDGFGAHLLSDQKVNTIAIDPANRKWFGTTNGIFVLDEDGTEVIHTFNTQNSPLPNNDIQSISIDTKTGIVYIGTSFGLISYRSQAVQGKTLHSSDIYAYPNPVAPDYTGPIAIRGLAQNATVKITDIEGRLVYETKALGGQAIWNGEDYNHQKVESGVYLVFSASQPGILVDAAVTKIVVVR